MVFNICSRSNIGHGIWIKISIRLLLQLARERARFCFVQRRLRRLRMRRFSGIITGRSTTTGSYIFCQNQFRLLDGMADGRKGKK